MTNLNIRLENYIKKTGKIPLPKALKQQQQVEDLGGEIKVPQWNCYCCLDKGSIPLHIASKFMEIKQGYNVIPCGLCSEGMQFLELTPYPMPPKEICQMIHEEVWADWQNWTSDRITKAKELVGEYTKS